jgi:hypothetical protein
MDFQDEAEANTFNLVGHLRSMARSLRKLKPEHWDFTFAPAAPTPRALAIHTWSWLRCDRQHIEQPDLSLHRPIPEPPSETEALCDALEAEANEWEVLLKRLTPEELLRVTPQFGRGPMNVRGYVAHMVQNVIYKHGQFATIFFALGYDGDAPYNAPFPNPLYKELLAIG